MPPHGLVQTAYVALPKVDQEDESTPSLPHWLSSAQTLLDISSHLISNKTKTTEKSVPTPAVWSEGVFISGSVTMKSFGSLCSRKLCMWITSTCEVGWLNSPEAQFKIKSTHESSHKHIHGLEAHKTERRVTLITRLALWRAWDRVPLGF